MDKYEKKVRVNQIISLIDKGAYSEALEIADTIDWRSEKSVRTLRMVSEIYKINRRYEDAFNVLTIAYEKNPDDPIKRKVVYDLCEVAVKLEQYAYAVKYLKQFAALAPNDPGRYVLQYKIMKSTGADYSERIEVLEEFKQNYFGDFLEKWAYELAQLYHITGQSQQCINACDEIILWFVKGPYVTKAKELKNSYLRDPVSDYIQTPGAGGQQSGFYQEQQSYDDGQYYEEQSYGGQSYDGQPYEAQGGYYGQEQPGSNNVNPYDPERSMQIEVKNVYTSNEPTIRMPDRQINNFTLREEEVSVNLDRYSTMNLQAELKANLDDLSARTGEPMLQKEESIPDPDEGMEMYWQQPQQPYPQQPYPQQQQPYPQQQYEPAAQQQPYPQTPPPEPEPEKPYERKFPEDERAEPEIVEVDRSEYVKDVPIYRQAPNDRTLYRAEESDKPAVIKKTEFGEALPRMPQQYRNLLSEGYDGQLNMNVPDEPAAIEKQITGQMDLATVLSQWEEVREESKRRKFATITPAQVSNVPAAGQPGVRPERMPRQEKTAVPVRAEKELIPADEASNGPQVKTINPEEIPEEPAKVQTDEIKEISPEVVEETSEDRIIEEIGEVSLEEPAEAEPEIPVKTDFTEDERDIFATFISIGRMSERLLEVIPRVSMTGSRGNLIITGNEPTLRLALAQSFARDIQQKNPMMGIKVAKIDADIFNTKDIEKSLKALDGNILVIEKAGRLAGTTIEKMTNLLATEGISILVILEDNGNYLSNLPTGDPVFGSVFSAAVDIPRFTNDDLVQHARDYAEEREYQIDDLAILALYRRIDELQTGDHSATASEVEKIMDDAIRSVNKKNMSHFMDVLFAKRYNDEDMIIIREKDFEKK